MGEGGLRSDGGAFSASVAQDARERDETEPASRTMGEAGVPDSRTQGPLALRHHRDSITRREAVFGGVVFEEFGVAAPVDGGGELALGFVGGVVFVQQV
jgi:hypothetical protein